ncbi:hypothetical protein C943_02510 [Mariniradius saccharolyticus AK6]|uniref:Uncharacterized protein n=1 Tax=Mariniradius saccharolyticus AK6 TaxID=1239962 RepID=M7X9R3_9BACT|nr:hypothetical protein C943_02510 [Mariniradius saccharolyticus AK6]
MGLQVHLENLLRGERPLDFSTHFLLSFISNPISLLPTILYIFGSTGQQQGEF